MAQLVGDHALELMRLEPLHQAGGDGDRGVLGAAAGGEGVGHVGVDQRHPGHRQVGGDAQPLDRGMQLRLLLGGHDLGPGGAQGDLVARPVLHPEQHAGQISTIGIRPRLNTLASTANPTT